MSFLNLLQHVEAISSCRDREKLPRALLRAVSALLGADADVGIFVREGRGIPMLRAFSGETKVDSAILTWTPLLDSVCVDGKLCTATHAGRQSGALTLQPSELGGDAIIAAFTAGAKDFAQRCKEIRCLAGIYGHQVRLLDYGELDSLTRLLNRKTFEETFDRLVSAPEQEESDAPFGERRAHDENKAPAWLCVIDVDHFKRVNDSFGHLFGDEVLLRMGELMRKTFRQGDRLFRFGGEEFVVILNAADEYLAASSFDRFRTSVEKHEFPQVGKVTCSIGFTAISGFDVPTDVVGRADEALYFAKRHGRNQVRCYERLVAKGKIVRPISVEAAANDDLDIDALFN